jgi:hypothetical protein
MVKSQCLMFNSPFLMVKSPFFMGKSPFFMWKTHFSHPKNPAPPVRVTSVELCQARVWRQLLRRQLLGRPGVALGLDVGAQIVTQPATGKRGNGFDFLYTCLLAFGHHVSV